MRIYGYIVVIVFFSLSGLPVVLSDEDTVVNDTVKVDDTERMTETLKREREELNKLKLTFQDTILAKADTVESDKTKTVAEKNKMVLTPFVKEHKKGGETLVVEEENVSSHKGECEVKEVITLESEDIDSEESKIVMKDGDEIIHPFEIAENLYKLGEYKTAIEIYKLVNKNKIEQEKEMWITYQIANCYRKLGAYSEAIAVYRDMQELYEGTYWAKQAQWYIQDISWRAKIEEKLERVVGR